MRQTGEKVRAFVKAEILKSGATLEKIIDCPSAYTRELLLLQTLDSWSENHVGDRNDLGSFMEAARLPLLMPVKLLAEEKPKEEPKPEKPKTLLEEFEEKQAAELKGKTYAWDLA